MPEPRAVSPKLFVEFHALVSHPPSNLNRDDLGSPKSCVFGGVRRLRISSQCLKRAWRLSEWFQGAFAEAQLGIRTQRVPLLVLEKLKETPISDAAREGLLALFGSLGRKTSAKDTESSEDGEKPEESDEQAPKATPEASMETAHLLFVTQEEIAALVEFARTHVKKLEGIYKLSKKGRATVDTAALKGVRDDLGTHLHDTCRRNAVDVALFGRFLTSDEMASCDASMQVAHALGTEPADITYDYFTAVDDIKEESGAGHLGECELAASVFYKYAVCDFASLRASLTRGEDVSTDDQKLAATAMGAMAQAIARTVPSGKKNSTAPQNPADYLEVVIRRNAPISLANAFLKPVRPTESRDVMDISIERLRKTGKDYEDRCSAEGDVVARFVLAFRKVELRDDEIGIESFTSLRKSIEDSLNEVEL